MWLLTIAGLSVLAAPTYSHQHAGTWLLVFIVCALPMRIVLNTVLPPWFEAGAKRFRFPFVAWYIAIALTLPVCVIVLGWFQVAIGASKSEIAESLVSFSIPLAWISSDFLIDGSKSFFDGCGIVLGNAFFYALAMFIAWRGTHMLLRRNRTTEIDIQRREPAEDDD